MIITVQYTADGAARAFAYPFWLGRAGDLDVLLGTAKQTAGYAVAILTDQPGGTVTFATAPAAGTLVTLTRDTEVVRRSQFVDGGTIAADDLNEEYDSIYAILQELAVRLGAQITVWPSPAASRRGVILRPDGTLTLSLEDPDVVATRASAAYALSAEAKAIAQQALAQMLPQLGAALQRYIHILVEGQTTYQCAEAAFPAPSVNNVSVSYDGGDLLAGIDYTLAADGLSIVLAGAVVSGSPTREQFKAGQIIQVTKLAGGLATAHLSPGQVTGPTIAAEAVTADKEADGTANSVRVYAADGRPAVVTGAAGQFLRFGAAGPEAATIPVATAAEVFAGTDATKAVTPATVSHGRLMPLFVGLWNFRATNGAMEILHRESTLPAPPAMTRIGPGLHRLTYPSLAAAMPMVTAYIAAGVAPVSCRVTNVTNAETEIAVVNANGPHDAIIGVVMYGRQ